MGSYKFNRVKSAPCFVKEMEILHFWEKIFHRNDSQGKVAAHKAAHKVNFEYAYYIDKQEQVLNNVYSMASLRKRLKGKAFGAKGSSSNNPSPDEEDEEAAKKAQEESTRRIAVGEKNLLLKKQRRTKKKLLKERAQRLF